MAKLASLLLAALLAPALGGCMTPAAPSTAVTAEHLAFNPSDEPGARPDIVLTARMQGMLGSDGRCLVVRQDGEAVTPLWPGGTTLRESGGRTVITLPHDRGQATIGERVTLSGGAFAVADVGRLADDVRRRCPAPFFAVSTVERSS